MRYRVFLFIEDELDDDYGEFHYLEKAEKEALKISRKFKGPKATAKIFEVDEASLFPRDGRLIQTWQMGRRIKN